MSAVVESRHQIGNVYNRYRLGTWVLLAAVVMLFTSLTSAYIVRAASANDWQAVPMPRVLWLSTGLILLSSVTLEVARRQIGRESLGTYVRWLLTSAALGSAFLVTQFIAWRQLIKQGLYVSTHPHSSFFYLLTAAHGIHLFGGLIVIAYLLKRAMRYANNEPTLSTRASADAATLYWHFMDGLWIYIFLLLFFWR
jgi:cytochrome c oxidase subunit III